MEYNDQPVLSIAPDFKKLKLGQLDDFVYDAQGFGAATPWKPTTRLKRTVTYPFLFGTRAAAKRFRGFKQAREGMRRGFWLPLYANDYPLLEDAAEGATGLVIEKVGLAQKFAIGAQFRHLALLDWAGKLECHGIDAVGVDGDTEVITLTEPLEASLLAARTVCCGLIFARFADPRTAYRYLSNDVAQTEVSFIELPTEFATPHTGSAICHLYEVSRGESVHYTTDWPLALEVEDETWAPWDISHGDISTGVEFISEPLELTVATDDPEHPFRYFLDRFGSEATQIRIFECDVDTLTADLDAPIFVGRCSSPQFKEAGGISVQVSSVFRLAEQKGPRMQVQRPCNHRLFDTYCGVNEATFTIAGEITALELEPNAWIEAAEYLAKATLESDPDWFALGRVTWNGQTRFCTGQDGDRLHLNAPFVGLEVGESVAARAGCDKLAGTCAGKFDNIINYGGFEVIPNKDPQFEMLESPKPKGGKKS